MTGWTSVKKFDPTTNGNQIYRSDTSFRGEKRTDWGLFTFSDERRKKHTLCAGMIYGFVRFENYGFPTSVQMDKYGDEIPTIAKDNTVYAAVRCCPDYHNFDKKFVTKLFLESGDKSLYMVPVRDLVGPLCVIPNVYTTYRMRQDQESWFAVKPRRKWGRQFGNSIKWRTDK